MGSVEYLDPTYAPPKGGSGVLRFLRVTVAFGWRFTHKVDCPSPVFGDQELAQIDFDAEVPWVLDAEEPE